MALANINTADFIEGETVSQDGNVISIGDEIYDLTSPTTYTVGGLATATDITGWTVKEILQAILTGVTP